MVVRAVSYKTVTKEPRERLSNKRIEGAEIRIQNWTQH